MALKRKWSKAWFFVVEGAASASSSSVALNGGQRNGARTAGTTSLAWRARGGGVYRVHCKYMSSDLREEISRYSTCTSIVQVPCPQDSIAAAGEERKKMSYGKFRISYNTIILL